MEPLSREDGTRFPPDDLAAIAESLGSRSFASAADVPLDGTLGRPLLRSTVSPARPWMLGPAPPPADLVAISALEHGP